MSLIKLCKINKHYMLGETRQPILHDIDLEVRRGDMLAIMGASGSGKSTLMNIIGLLDRANSGDYFLRDKRTSRYQDDELADLRNQTIGFVFQQFFLLPRLTAAQNVALPLTYRGMNQTEIHDKVMTMLAKVGMSDKANNRPNQLSGGQQQRVAIARALVGDPDVILADEPTGALDSQTGSDVMNLFHQLNQRESRTVIIVTHDHDIGASCQQSITIKDGYIIERRDGEHGA